MSGTFFPSHLMDGEDSEGFVEPVSLSASINMLKWIKCHSNKADVAISSE